MVRGNALLEPRVGPMTRMTGVQHLAGVPGVSGCGILPAGLGAAGITPADTVVADSRVPLPPTLRQALGIVVIDGALAQRELVENIVGAHRGGSIGVIGGGRLLDAAKLARLAIDAGSLAATLTERALRYGVAYATRRMATRLVMVPTTIGTGCEQSAVACLEGPYGRRLIAGDGVRGDAFVIDAALTATLSRSAIADGAAEIVLRVLGAVTGSTPDPDADAGAAWIVTRVAQTVRERRLDTQQSRLTLARLSAATHTSGALDGRNPFAARHWYLANDLSAAARSLKVPTTVALLPSLWQRVLDGDERWGRSDRLRLGWSWLADTCGYTSDPVAGVQQWSDDWRLTPLAPLDPAIISDAARRCAATWGGRRPMLAGIDAGEITSLYAEVASRHSRAGKDHREEVRRT